MPKCRDVREMGEIIRLNLRLNLEDPFHKKAWDILSRVPKGQRSNKMCEGIIATAEQASLRTILREELHQIQIIRPEQEIQPEDDSVLDFLLSLQKGADL